MPIDFLPPGVRQPDGWSFLCFKGRSNLFFRIYAEEDIQWMLSSTVISIKDQGGHYQIQTQSTSTYFCYKDNERQFESVDLDSIGATQVEPCYVLGYLARH